MSNPIVDVSGYYGMRASVQYDDLSDLMVLKSSQDVEPILDFCQESRDKFTRFGDGIHFVGSVPMDLINDYMYRTGVNLLKKENMDVLKQLLNTGDFKPFKAIPGYI